MNVSHGSCFSRKARASSRMPGFVGKRAMGLHVTEGPFGRHDGRAGQSDVFAKGVGGLARVDDIKAAWPGGVFLRKRKMPRFPRKSNSPSGAAKKSAPPDVSIRKGTATRAPSVAEGRNALPVLGRERCPRRSYCCPPSPRPRSGEEASKAIAFVPSPLSKKSCSTSESS